MIGNLICRCICCITVKFLGLQSVLDLVARLHKVWEFSSSYFSLCFLLKWKKNLSSLCTLITCIWLLLWNIKVKDILRNYIKRSLSDVSVNSFNQLQSKPPKGKSFFICFFTFSFLHCVLYIYFSILPFSLQGVIRYDLLANPMSGDMCVASSRKCCSYCPTPVAGWSRSHPCPPAGRWSTRQRGCDTLWTTILAPPPLKTPDQALSQGKNHTP